METKKLKDLSFEAFCGIIAKVIHSANVAYVDAIGGRTVNPSWEEAREEQRDSLIKAVASTIVNPLTPQISHEQWCVTREKEGWTRDLKYDFNRKTHPNMVPFDQLTPEEQFKPYLYMGIASIFCGSFGILDMPEVQAARKILQDQFAAKHPPIEAPEEVNTVDPSTTEALQEKLAEAKEKLAAAEAEKEAAANGEQDGELAAVKTAAEGRDAAEVDPLADVKVYPDATEKVGIEDGVGSGSFNPELPIPELAEAVMEGSPREDIKIEDTPAEAADGANDTPDADQGSKQDKDEPVKTSDVQESTANGAGKSDPKGEATSEDSEKVEPAKPKAKKPAKKRSGK